MVPRNAQLRPTDSRPPACERADSRQTIAHLLAATTPSLDDQPPDSRGSRTVLRGAVRAPRSRRTGFARRRRFVRGRPLPTEICIESRDAFSYDWEKCGQTYDRSPRAMPLPSKLRKSSEIFPSAVTLAIRRFQRDFHRTHARLFVFAFPPEFSLAAPFLSSPRPAFPRVLMDGTSFVYLRFRSRG